MGVVKRKLGALLAGEDWPALGKQMEESPVFVEQLCAVEVVLHG